MYPIADTLRAGRKTSGLLAGATKRTRYPNEVWVSNTVSRPRCLPTRCPRLDWGFLRPAEKVIAPGLDARAFSFGNLVFAESTALLLLPKGGKGGFEVSPDFLFQENMNATIAKSMAIQHLVDAGIVKIGEEPRKPKSIARLLGLSFSDGSKLKGTAPSRAIVHWAKTGEKLIDRNRMAAIKQTDREIIKDAALLRSAANQLAARNKKKFRDTGLLDKDFYSSKEWRELRYSALKKSDRKCSLCGASSVYGAELHVDHIVPRSLAPRLALSIENLQVLCKDCNLGKGYTDVARWNKAKS